jgi:hypothetical protein
MSASDEAADGGAIAPRVFGEFSDYNSLVALLRQCKDARQVSFATIDEIGGFPTGQSSKILAPKGERKVTWQTFGYLLGALALKCVIVSDDDALRRINGRMVKRDASVARESVHIILSRQHLREIGRRGAAARWGRRMKFKI